MRVAAIVVAAGSGTRYGDRKQFVELNGRSAASLAVSAARSVAEVVVLVAPSDAVADRHGADHAVPGGATRSSSVRAGLAAIGSDVEVIVVHDAARPLASPELFHAVVHALVGDVVGAVPGLAVADTLKRVRSGTPRDVVETIDRASVVAVQTPQAFRAEALRRAHESGADATDDAALVEATGGRVVIVNGEGSNRKLTTPEDLAAMLAELERP